MTIPGSVAIIGETIQQGARTPIAPDKIFPILSKGQTAINVSESNVIVFLNTGPLTVLNFTGGQVGQEIKLLGDGNTTLANNANIQTASGADELLADGAFVSLLLYNGIWFEQTSNSTSGGTSGGGGGTPPPPTQVPFNIPFEFGDGVNIASGVSAGLFEIDFDCTISQQTIKGNVSGSAVVDILTAPSSGSPFTSICGSAKPTLVGQDIERDSTLAGWSLTISAGTLFRADLISVSGCKLVAVTLKAVRTI